MPRSGREERLTCTVYLQTPRVFQSLMVLSLEPETIWRLSEEKATLSTSLVWPTKRRVVVPLKGRCHFITNPVQHRKEKAPQTESHFSLPCHATSCNLFPLQRPSPSGLDLLLGRIRLIFEEDLLLQWNFSGS